MALNLGMPDPLAPFAIMPIFHLRFTLDAMRSLYPMGIYYRQSQRKTAERSAPMNFLFLRRKAETPPISPKMRAISLTRTFVETGDERYPLAGIWMRLADDCPASASAPDEPERTQPAMRRFLLWRAFHLCLTTFRYSIACPSHS